MKSDFNELLDIHDRKMRSTRLYLVGDLFDAERFITVLPEPVKSEKSQVEKGKRRKGLEVFTLFKLELPSNLLHPPQ
ncbi:hypothetical protein pdam_00003883 [Pocillopora damicornis]|uniref:Uncharacterized protein n=1 Tax=Pocillopora damicornis TaxID=46731 RepID=A0A3M6U6G1_POCDA|nr:hypothetical protein pdam_00003883 [Pocillopora damicornis]